MPAGRRDSFQSHHHKGPEGSLLQALGKLVPGASNRTLRQMLEHGRVSLNGTLCKVGRRRVLPGDLIEISSRAVPPPRLYGLKIVYEDEALLVVEKPAGLLTVATEHEREKTAYACLRAFCRRINPHQKLFVVHRLDKFVSGVLVFAKTEEAKARLQKLFQRHAIDRRYWALVEGKVTKQEGCIRSRIAEDRTGRVHSTQERNNGKPAVTHWRVLRQFPGLTLLEVRLETGRKNQIRVHLSEMGHPIVGDKAYGSSSDPFRRIALHAFCLGFVHPIQGSSLRFETDPPLEFRRFLNHPAGHEQRQDGRSRNLPPAGRRLRGCSPTKIG